MTDLKHIRNRSASAAAFCALSGMLLLAPPMSNSLAQSTPTNTTASHSKSWDQIVEDFGGTKSSVKVDPCRDVVMRFTFATEVAQILVKGGERVKQGQLLAKARDADILAAIEQQRLTADSTHEIEGAKVSMELAQFRLDQFKRAGEFTPDEFERAKADALTTKVQYEQAQLNAQLQKAKLKQLDGQYERYSLTAPFDGIVENVMIDVGKSVGENVDALRIVNIDQLWLDAYPDTEQTLKLKLDKGSPAWILLNLPDRPALVEGKVLYVSPASDYVGQSRRVRVEIENPLGWPSGLQAGVRFTPPTTEYEQYAVKLQPIRQSSSSEPTATAPPTFAAPAQTPGKSAPRENQH